MKKEVKKMGRPFKDNPRSTQLPVIRTTPDELQAYKSASERSGKTFSAWVRGVLDRAASK